MEFSPFENRLCRDVRNNLAKSFMEALQENRIDAVVKTALGLKQRKLAPCHEAYIDNRLAQYQAILTQLASGPADMFTTARLLWDQALFFECHEWLEPFWFRAEGNEKQLIQALIRAAAAHMFLDAGRKAGSKKAAEKALAFLSVNKSAIPSIFEPDQLISGLKTIVGS